MNAATSDLRFDEVAPALPYHAALVLVTPDGRGRLRTHGHADFYELVCVVAGRGTHRVGGRELPLRAGGLVLVRPRDRHGFSGAGPDGVRFVNVAFPVTAWRSFADLAGVDSATDWDRQDLPPQAADGPAAAALAAEFQLALEAYQRGPRMLDLVRLWSSVIPVLEGADVPAHGRPGWLAGCCAAMNGEENLRGGLQRMLELAAVSHGHLARSMREHYGCTPVEFVTERRLAHAAALLATTIESAGRIADRCGYDSLSYFGRVFRRRYGMSPREYRSAAHRAVVPEA
ncbi:AraC family transcriptional regulator [Streptomyces sp. ISL-100]|uniref:helix-turn-helix transcriptional regulator n=1 Tax=Streptomyces sp. ISL-100 TaxID=2819173 RepID=UPI001BECA3BA|nr:AraC family transcriptional regulator [Streptomyces sp. ISL-100]MBT2395375.1 helix-turn-helix domain-containing protein [Streptomyces sp. ISL-100]